ncbi:MAG: hypothetical protein H6873_11785 [Hyphomicrobiaceae bacterium]|nr:hypothetical protein [Hyphomicrobiaceae bacterium]
MRTIDVSTPVFAAIWAARRDGEETENAILERILGIAKKHATNIQRKDGVT